MPVCPGCGAVAERMGTHDHTWLETLHDRDCPWMNELERNPDDEPTA